MTGKLCHWRQKGKTKLFAHSKGQSQDSKSTTWHSSNSSFLRLVITIWQKKIKNYHQLWRHAKPEQQVAINGHHWVYCSSSMFPAKFRWKSKEKRIVLNWVHSHWMALIVVFLLGVTEKIWKLWYDFMAFWWSLSLFGHFDDLWAKIIICEWLTPLNGYKYLKGYQWGIYIFM